MGKPEDIPQDVWDKACVCVPDYVKTTIKENIARAIMAERSRCASLVFVAYERKTEICYKIVRRIRSGEGLVR